MKERSKSQAKYYTLLALFPTAFIIYAVSLLNTDVLGLHNWVFLTKTAWFLSMPFVISNLVGLFLYGSPEIDNNKSLVKLSHQKWNKKKKLLVSYVSYGKNSSALKRAVSASRQVLNSLDVNYEIEVITDIPVRFLHSGIKNILVPKEYVTENKTKFKARALNYASSIRDTDIDTWILHLDEESVVTESSVAGIHSFINKYDIDCIGQGEIKYNSYKYFSNPLIAAVDSIRTGDDLGRFRFQYKLFNSPIYGIHGSFVLINSLTEYGLGFDVGEEGSLTEDTFFAIKAADLGFKFMWCDGYIREQSPFSIFDLIKQRRRWLNGLSKLTASKEISFKRKSILSVAIFSWGLSWLSVIATLLNLFMPSHILPLPFHILSALCAGLFMSVYAIGAYRNVIDIDQPALTKLGVILTVIAFVPIASVVEAVAVLYALINPIKTQFQVVEKN